MSTSPILRDRWSRLTATALMVVMLMLPGLGISSTSASAEEPTLPKGQSNQPAPASREKLVIENVHTDAVSAYLDDGKLVAETKADLDADGDGVIDLGTRLITKELLFHVDDAAIIKVPDQPEFAFLGQPGDTIWLAPMTQNHDLIWPGFSTEDPNLRGKAESLEVRLLGVAGPGAVEVFMGPESRVFSSKTELPPWTIGVPQHTHMNWAFAEPGTYVFTFELSGWVDGRQQTARNDYTFVVGPLEVNQKPTSVSVEAGSTNLEQGESVMFTATVTPKSTAGAVQFWDLSSGTILGHTPVVDGRAQFLAEALNPGSRRIVADFLPTWSTDAQPSSSISVNVTVAGEVQLKPDRDDTEPVSDAELNDHPAGSGVEVTSDGKKAGTGTAVTARVTDPALAGHWLSVWLPGQNPAWRGWVQASQRGSFTVELNGVPAGAQRLVVKDATGALVGWDRVDVVAPPSTGGGIDGGGPATGGTTGGGGDSGTPAGSGQGGPGAAPSAPAQTCQPGITLDHGHIDAFYVSASGAGAVLQLMEDVTGYHIIREAETVLLRVKESARTTVAGAPRGTPSTGYVLPLTQHKDLIWPGWDTNRTMSSGYTDVQIRVTRVQGPGSVSLYTQGAWGAWAPILTSGSYTLPGTIREKTPAHTHAQWVFSEKGIYKLTAYAVATNPNTGQSLTTASHSYVFQVGDVPLGDVFCGTRAHGAAAAAKVNAAVDRAAEEALAEARAAEQADTETGDDTGETPEGGTPEGGTPGARRAGGDAPLGGLLGEDGSVLLAGLLGLGGGLVIAGIVGGTVWYVRRLGTTPVPGMEAGSTGPAE